MSPILSMAMFARKENVSYREFVEVGVQLLVLFPLMWVFARAVLYNLLEMSFSKGPPHRGIRFSIYYMCPVLFSEFVHVVMVCWENEIFHRDF